MGKTTVIIPNYKGIQYIEACLQSLTECREQTEFQILMVDNASGDGSVELVREKFPEVAVIELEENTGFCHGVNVGIAAATTEYVILLNNDTVVEKGFVAALEKAIEASEDIFSVSSLMLCMQNPELVDDAGDNLCLVGYAYARGKGKPAKDYDKVAEVFSACGGAAIYRRELVNRLGGFDENHFAYLEDVDIGYRARLYGYRNMYEPTARVLHAGSAVSGSRHNPFKVKLSSANASYMIGKNMPLLQILFNLPFLFLGLLIKTVFFARKGMGLLYLTGYMKGIGRCFSKEGRKRIQPYNIKKSGTYFRIQMQLIKGLVNIFIKS